MRVMAIGVDGLSFRLAEKWAGEGHMPRLRSIMDRGSRGVLKSTMPPLTPPAWYSSLTGLNPGRQNIFGFFRGVREHYAKTPVTAADLKAPVIWDYIGKAGKKSIILYLPLSYPPREINGLMVSGFMTPDGADDFTSPPDIAGEIFEAVPDFRLNPDHSHIRLGHLKKFYDDSLDVMNKQTTAAIHLMKSRPWDFFFVHIHEIDSITHLFWKYQDRDHPGHRSGHPHETLMKEYYRSVDDEVGRLLDAAGEDTAVLLYSDHGFMPAYRYFSVNRWLVDRGYMSLRRKGRLGVKTMLSSMGLGKEKMSWWASRLGLKPLVKRLPKRIKAAFPQTRFSFNTLADHVDWKNTKAYFLSSSEGSLYANIDGREPSGCLSGNEAEKVLEEIRQGLTKVKDPVTGKPILAGAYHRREIYSGEYSDNSPDMILLPEEGCYFSENGFGPLFGDQGMDDHQISATHHPDGVFMAAGGPISRSEEGISASIWDIAPTVLCLLGVPLPGDLDGKVIREAIADGFLDENPIRYEGTVADAVSLTGDAVGPGEMKKIMQNLEDLGYY